MYHLTFGYDLYKKNKNNAPVTVGVNYEKVTNPHMIVLGTTGTGKSYSLRKIAEVLSRNLDARIHVIDRHGDLTVPNASSIMFSETSDYGINPLKLSTHYHFGGVRKKVNNFISAINKTSRKLGNRQEATLRNVLYDLYRANGFFEDNPETWKLESSGKWRRKYPNLNDLHRFLESKLKSKLFGMNRESIKHFEELQKLNKTLYRLHKEQISNDTKELEKKINETKEKIKEAFLKGLETSNGSEIDDILKYDNPETLRSVFDIINNMIGMGIFKDKIPDFKPDYKVWRYIISSLNPDEQRLFVEFVSEELFNESREQGERSIPNKFLMIDEAHLFLDKKRNDDMLKIIALEARKFGFGLILATQSYEHIPNEIFENVGTKIILGVDTSKIAYLSKKLDIDPKYIKNIIPKKTALIQVKNSGSLSNYYHNVYLDIK